MVTGQPDDSGDEPAHIDEAEILHVLVGHGLPVMFRNAVASFRSVCPTSEVLVVDNASPQEWLRKELAARAESDPHMDVLLRRDNDRVNSKVGGLYHAYEDALAIARDRGFDYVHLVQADCQMMWWDADILRKIADLYRRHPRCVNVHTRAVSGDRMLMGDVVPGPLGDAIVPRYGVTDTGMVHLERWDRHGLRFSGSEEDTAAHALSLGIEAVVSPWPTEVPVPWPAVVRRGRQVGREVRTGKPLLCRPLHEADIARIKSADHPPAWEEICVPWGWACLAPMSETDLANWSYFDCRRRDITRNGWRRGRPHLVTAGLDRRSGVLTAAHRPPIVAFLVRPLPSLVGELTRRLRRRARSRLSARGRACT
ncbi:MAG: hypothetical protein ACRDV8_01275 [Acidimicrobiales bacterium]